MLPKTLKRVTRFKLNEQENFNRWKKLQLPQEVTEQEARNLYAIP